MIKINNKIAIITVFLSLIITILVGLTSIIVSMYVINTEASENLLLLTQNKAYILEDAFKKIEVTTNNLADYIEISFSHKKFHKYGVDYLKNYTESIVPLIKNVVINTDKVKGCYFNFDPEITSGNKVYEVWVYNNLENGKNLDIVMIEPISNYYPIDRQDLEWFYEPKLSEKPVWSDIYTDQALSVLMISYIKPLYAENKFIGTVGIDMSIEKLENMISDLKIYDTGYAFLLNKNLNLVIHKKSKINKNLEKTNNELYKSLKKKYNTNETGIINYQENNIQKVACFKKLSNDLIFVITVPKAEMLRQKFNLQVLAIGITSLSILLAFLIIINEE